jgi:hypothetical protein
MFAELTDKQIKYTAGVIRDLLSARKSYCAPAKNFHSPVLNAAPQ